jgi:hypothetical protein
VLVAQLVQEQHQHQIIQMVVQAQFQLFQVLHLQAEDSEVVLIALLLQPVMVVQVEEQNKIIMQAQLMELV